MSDDSPPPPPLQRLYEPLPFTDMRALMIIMGILIMISSLACGCGVGAPTDLMPMMIMAASQPDTGSAAAMGTICFALFYLLSVTGMIWLGIGSILIHKWARSLLYAMGWFQAALTLGLIVCAIPIFASVMSFAKTMAPTSAPGGTGGAGVVMQTGALMTMMVGMQVAFRLVPAALLIIVYGLRGVRLTVNHFDRQPRWTDGLSVELLCWWIFLIWAGCVCLLIGPLYAVAGHELDFPLSPVLCGSALGITGIGMLVIAWATARRKTWAWVAGLSAVLTPLLGIIVTLASFDLAAYVRERFPITPDPANPSLENMQKELVRFLESSQTFWMPFVIAAVLLVSFLVWIKPHFEKDWVRGKSPVLAEN